MTDSFRSLPGATARFFDNYLICLSKASVPEKQRRWYVKRVEGVIKAHSGRKIKSLSGEEISRYLEMIGREKRLKGWHKPNALMQYGFFIAIFLGRKPVRKLTGHTGKTQPGSWISIIRPLPTNSLPGNCHISRSEKAKDHYKRLE